MAYYKNCNKPVRINLAEGAGFSIRREAPSAFRREHRRECEGEFWPWKEGQDRRAFVELSALLWRLEQRRPALEGYLAYFGEKANEAGKKCAMPKKAADEARKRFEKNAQAALGAMASVEQNFNLHGECLAELSRAALGYGLVGRQMSGFSEKSEFYENVQVGRQDMEERVAFVGWAVYSSMERVHAAIGIAENGGSGAAQRKSAGAIPAAHAFDLLMSTSEMGKDAKFLEEQEALSARIGKARTCILERGLGAETAAAFFAEYLGCDLGALSDSRQEWKQEAEMFRKPAKELLTDRYSGTRLEVYRKRAPKESDAQLAVQALADLRAAGVRAMMGLEGMLDAEAAFCASLERFARCVQLAAGLEGEAARAEGALEPYLQSVEWETARLEKNRKKFESIYGGGRAVGIFQLAQAKKTEETYRAQQDAIRRARNGARQVELQLQEEEKPKERFVFVADASAPAEQPVAKAEFFTPHFTAAARKDMKGMTPDKIAAFEKCAATLRLANGYPLRINQDGIMVFREHLPSGNDMRLLFAKVGKTAAVLKCFLDTQTYNEWVSGVNKRYKRYKQEWKGLVCEVKRLRGKP